MKTLHQISLQSAGYYANRAKRNYGIKCKKFQTMWTAGRVDPPQEPERHLLRSACTLLDLTVMYIAACNEERGHAHTQFTH